MVERLAGRDRRQFADDRISDDRHELRAHVGESSRPRACADAEAYWNGHFETMSFGLPKGPVILRPSQSMVSFMSSLRLSIIQPPAPTPSARRSRVTLDGANTPVSGAESF